METASSRRSSSGVLGVTVALLSLLGLACGPGADAGQEGAALQGSVRVQAEDYRAGGPGVGYSDTTPGNTGGAYRHDDVDLQVTSDVGGGFNVGWTAPGEWLSYSVPFTSAGTYRLSLRVASSVQGTKSLRVLVDGKDATGPVTFTDASGWQSWKDLVTPAFSVVAAGPHDVRIAFDTAGFNLNYFDVQPLSVKSAMAIGVAGLIGPLEQRIGKTLSAHRIYNPGFSPNFMQFAADDIGKRTTVFSSKPNIAAAATGALDAQFGQLVDSIPAGHPTYLVIWHEPEDNIAKGEFSAADFRAAYRHFSAVVKGKHRPEVKVALCLMTYSFTPASKRNPEDYYPGPGVVDLYGFDGYAHGTMPMSSDFTTPFAWARAKGARVGIFETGMVASNPSQPAWVGAGLDWARASGSDLFLYFDVNYGGIDWSLTSASEAVIAKALP